MNKGFLIALIACLSLSSATFAQDQKVERNLSAGDKQTGYVPPVAVPAPAASATSTPAAIPSTITVTAPDGCKFVEVHRPDIDAEKPEIYLTFRGYGSDVDAIEACNTDSDIRAGVSNVFGVVSSPTAGARVSVRTKNGVGVIGLPTILADGNVHQVHCKTPTDDGKFPFDFYKTSWKGGLPNEINLASAPMPDQEGTRICKAALLPNLRAKLNDKK